MSYGPLLINCEISFNGTAAMAKWRLQHIVARDREVIADGAWRPRVKGEFYPGKEGQLPFRVKPRWRWEIHR